MVKKKKDSFYTSHGIYPHILGRTLKKIETKSQNYWHEIIVNFGVKLDI